MCKISPCSPRTSKIWHRQIFLITNCRQWFRSTQPNVANISPKFRSTRRNIASISLKYRFHAMRNFGYISLEQSANFVGITFTQYCIVSGTHDFFLLTCVHQMITVESYLIIVHCLFVEAYYRAQTSG